MMIPQAYLAAVRGVLDHLERTQLPAVDRAAGLVESALTGGGAVFCHGLGHGTEGDFINRAGGLAAVQKFSFSFSVSDPVADCLKDRPRPEPVERDLEAIRLAVRTGNLRAGDVMLVGSVSGRNRGPVELALACRAAGVRVVGFTAFAYTERVTSLHPSGKRLKEAVDVAVDIGAPYGDAAVDVPGYDIKLLPVSGVAMDVAGWMVWGRALERMAAAGTPASVFMSVNREDGPAYYERSKARYQRGGF